MPMGTREPGSDLLGNQKRSPTFHLGGGKSYEVAPRRNCPGGSSPKVHNARGPGPMAPLSPSSGSVEERCLEKASPGTHLPSPRQELLRKLQRPLHGAGTLHILKMQDGAPVEGSRYPLFPVFNDAHLSLVLPGLSIGCREQPLP